MRKVLIFKGLPASGKTTKAKEIVKKRKASVKRVNKDDLRNMLDASEWSKGNEKYILNLRDHIIITALNDGKSVIVDDTNLHPKHEKRIRELVKNYNEGKYGGKHSEKNPVQVKVEFFDIEPKEAIKRDLKRPNSVGAGIIWDMYNRFLKPEKEEIKPLEQNPELPRAIIVDLDGSLCLHNGREPYEYDKCDTDLVNTPVRTIIGLNASRSADTIFLSGREDSCREKTIQWLYNNTGFNREYIDNQLFMRKTGDYRKDFVIKKEIFEKYIKDKYFVEFVLDDRNQVVQMWRDLGLTCLQVADGDF